MVSCQEPSPLKESKHSQQCHPHDTCTFVCIHGGGGKVSPLQKHCTLQRQPFLCNGCPCCGRHHCHCHRRLRCRRRCRHNRPLPIPVAVAISHCRCGCRRPSLLPSLSHCHQPLLLPSPLLSAIAVSIPVGHCSCHCRRPSPLPCRWPFLRVVALAQQKLYSTN
jgi:hypothetical protein